MFTAYAFPIQTALLFFPALAALFTLPYLLSQYHKYGAVSLVRSLVVYSFALYLLCAYFEVILPLPSFAAAAAKTGPTYALIPYASLRRALAAGMSPAQLLHSHILWESLLNIALTVPFGVYLRYYFRRNWWQTGLASFALSLFFELTQLSALYGIYPHPYRLFDTTDLINNTLGGMVGFWAAPLLIFFLPSRERLEAAAYRRGAKVGLLRRALAVLVDWSLLFTAFVLFFVIFRTAPILVFCALSPLYFILLPPLTGGYTAGKALCSIRVVKTDGSPAGLWRCAARYALVYLPLTNAPWLAAALWRQGRQAWQGPAGAALAVCLGCMAVLAAETLPKLFGFCPRYLYERISGTRLVSSIPAARRRDGEP